MGGWGYKKGPFGGSGEASLPREARTGTSAANMTLLGGLTLALGQEARKSLLIFPRGPIFPAGWWVLCCLAAVGVGADYCPGSPDREEGDKKYYLNVRRREKGFLSCWGKKNPGEINVIVHFSETLPDGRHGLDVLRGGDDVLQRGRRDGPGQVHHV